MLEDRLKILLIEDNAAYARLIKEMCLDCEGVNLDIQLNNGLGKKDTGLSARAALNLSK